jgi:hypothetical protein
MENDKVSISEVLDMLEKRYDIRPDRKTIADDILAIDRFVPIESVLGVKGGYQKCKLLED